MRKHVISSISIFSFEQYNQGWELKQLNKKDIANIRKEFKLDNYRMNIREIFNVYVKKESGEIYHHVSQPFQMLEQEAQELFLTNFKKVLTGNLDTKLFELKFKQDVEDSTQRILLMAYMWHQRIGKKTCCKSLKKCFHILFTNLIRS